MLNMSIKLKKRIPNVKKLNFLLSLAIFSLPLFAIANFVPQEFSNETQDISCILE